MVFLDDVAPYGCGHCPCQLIRNPCINGVVPGVVTGRAVALSTGNMRTISPPVGRPSSRRRRNAATPRRAGHGPPGAGQTGARSLPDPRIRSGQSLHLYFPVPDQTHAPWTDRRGGGKITPRRRRDVIPSARSAPNERFRNDPASSGQSLGPKTALLQLRNGPSIALATGSPQPVHHPS